MTMSLKDFGLLKAAMMRTTSDSDSEALGALRIANGLLASHKLSWLEVFARTVTVINEIDGTLMVQNQAEEVDLEAAFEAAMDSAHGDFKVLIESLYERYQKSGRLSPRQLEVVMNAAGQ